MLKTNDCMEECYYCSKKIEIGDICHPCIHEDDCYCHYLNNNEGPKEGECWCGPYDIKICINCLTEMNFTCTEKCGKKIK